METDERGRDPLNIAELIRQIDAQPRFRLSSVFQQPQTHREWQMLLDEHTQGQATCQTADEYIGRMVADLSRSAQAVGNPVP